MSKETEYLKMFQYQKDVDKDKTFNIDAAINNNLDKIDKHAKNTDTKLNDLQNTKVTKVPNKQLSTEDYTTGEKQKLAGIEKGANKYIHPQNSSTRHVSDSEKNKWNNAVSKSGDTMIGTLNAPDRSSIYGRSSGKANTAFLQFMEQNKTTRQGYIGFSSTVDNNLILYNDTADGIIRLYTQKDSAGALQFNNRKIWHENNDGDGSGLDADMLDGKHYDEFTKRINLTPSTSIYAKMVIGLCKIDNSVINRYSCTDGTLSFVRWNGLFQPFTMNVLFQKTYNKERATFSYVSRNHYNELNACTFTYNGTKYAGIQFYIQQANYDGIKFNGETTEDIFAVKYYDTQTNTPTNTEINNSLSFDFNNEGEPVDDSIGLTRVAAKDFYRINNFKIWNEQNSYPVIEQGSNSNGYYMKFADGTQICHTVKVINEFTTAQSTIQGITQYRSNPIVWTFPSVFIDNNNKCFINLTTIRPATGGARGDLTWGGSTVFETTKTNASIQAWVFNPDAKTGVCPLFAIGRWK